jgi:tetratricopeptide (TPR) repeat protein
MRKISKTVVIAGTILLSIVAQCAFAAQSTKQTTVTIEQVGALLKQCKTKEALAALKLGFSQNPKWTEGYVLRAKIYEATNQRGLAIEDYCRALQTKPTDIPLLTIRAQARMDAWDYIGCLEDADEIARIAPNNPEGPLMRSAVYCRMRQYAKAEDECSTAVKLGNSSDKSHQIALLRRAACRLAKDNYSGALSDLNDRSVTANYSTLMLLFLAHYFNQEQSAALAALEALSKEKQGEETSCVLKVVTLAADGAAEAAHKEGQLLLSSKTLSPSSVATVQASIADAPERLNLLNADIAAHRDEYTNLLIRADIYNTTQKFNEALADCAAAQKLKSKDDTWLLTELARAKLGLNRVDEAMRDLNKAISVSDDPQLTAAAYHWRAEVNDRSGKFEASRADKAKATELGSVEDKSPAQQFALTSLRSLKSQLLRKITEQY